MAHFAKVVDGIVTEVIVAEQDFIDSMLDTTPGTWIKCSYNTRKGVHYESDGVTPSADQTKALRKNYPGIGFKYDKQADAFHSQRPYNPETNVVFNSWTLNTTTYAWEPPTPRPTDGSHYEWNETTTAWERWNPETRTFEPLD